MIFITLGSQKFQFNRLLIEVDSLIEGGYIKEEVFAQIGYSDYKPKNYKYKSFLDRDEFDKIMKLSDKVITHGGTGAIVGAIKKDKKVIAIPRLKQFAEHVDDHQLQITRQFKESGFIESIEDIADLKYVVANFNEIEFKKYISNTSKIISSIDDFLNTI